MQFAKAFPVRKAYLSSRGISLFYFITFMVMIFSSVSIHAEDFSASYKPFIGIWEGEWSFAGGDTSWGGRPCKLMIYLQGNEVYVDYSVGAKSSMGSLDTTAGHQLKIRADLKTVNGSPCLIFSSGANEYIWHMENGKLVGQPNNEGEKDTRCVLSRARMSD